MKFSLASTLKVVAVSALIGTASLAQAQAPAAATAAPADKPSVTSAQENGRQGAHHGKWQGKKHMHKAHRDAAMWVPGLGPVSKTTVDSLALNQQQSDLLKAAQDQQKAVRQASRDAMKQVRAERAELITSDTLNPRAAVQAMNQRHEQLRADQAKVQEKWLAVWDSLDDKQRQTLSDNFRDHAQKHVKRMQERAERKAS
jgi:protein CpxP